MIRPSKRANDEMRSISIERNVSLHPEGSCLIKCGNTHVLCTASVEERVPPWMRGKGTGWVTAEYGMLPRSTSSRMRRESTAGKMSGRTQEISRLIGRSLRAVVDMDALGEQMINLDCDVLQADGGTRCASITGAWIALNDAISWMKEREMIGDDVLKGHVAAVSCGLYQGDAVLDLDYDEDSNAEADTNFIMTDTGGIVEIQGTAEADPFSESQFSEMMALAKKGVNELVASQKGSIG